MLIELATPLIAQKLCRYITADLPEYFGIPQYNEHYAVGVCSRINFAVEIDSQYVGLISVDFPYLQNANIYWLGVLKKSHRQSIGRKLIRQAVKYAVTKGAKTISVETLAPQEGDENYLKTYQFYQNMGFHPLFNLKPEGSKWNMVYMVKFIDSFKLV